MAVMFMPNSPNPPSGITCNFKSVFKSLIHLHFLVVSHFEVTPPLTVGAPIRAATVRERMLTDNRRPVARIVQHSARPGLAVAHAYLALVSIRPPAPGSGLPFGRWKTCGKSAPPCARASVRKIAETPGTQRARPAWRWRSEE